MVGAPLAKTSRCPHSEQKPSPSSRSSAPHAGHEARRAFDLALYEAGLAISPPGAVTAVHASSSRGWTDPQRGQSFTEATS
jgi:hypothetical protein